MTPIDAVNDPEERLLAGVLPQRAAGVASAANADVDPAPIGDPDNDEGYDDDDEDEDEDDEEDGEEPLQCCASDRSLTPAARLPGSRVHHRASKSSFHPRRKLHRRTGDRQVAPVRSTTGPGSSNP